MSFGPSRIFRALKCFFRYRHVYASCGDAWQAVKLRLASNRDGHIATAEDERPLRLAGLPHDIYLRRGTSDFLVVYSLFEKEAYRAARQMKLPTDALVIDLGGNIGLSVLYFSLLAPRGRFITVEPDAPNCQLIEKNCRFLAEDGRLHIVQAFAGAADGTAGIDREVGSWSFRKLDAAADGEAIPCISMNTLLKRYAVEQVDLLKCNIEGSEVELFRTCGPWIGRVRNLTVEAHRPYTHEELYRALREAGWKFREVWKRVRTDTTMCFLEQV